MDIEQIFKSAKTIAVYGMSRDENKTSHIIPLQMKKFGYQIIPINPTADQIAGIKAYHNLFDVKEYIDILDVFRPSIEATDIVKQAIIRHRQVGDTNIVWLQEGIISDEAKQLAEQAGLIFIQDTCIYKAYLLNHNS